MSDKIITTMKETYAHVFLRRPADAHKGQFGHLFIIAGSRGLTGAAYLVCQSALRSGAGLVTLATPASVNDIMEVKLTEAMTFPVEDAGKGFFMSDQIDCVVNAAAGKGVLGMGPGLSREEETGMFVRGVYAKIEQPCVLDADGLNAFIDAPHLLRREEATRTIITPHTGECDRLFKTTLTHDSAKRKEVALRIAQEYNVIIVLKGHHTIVASPEGEWYQNETGNPGMATGGTGDCLCGIIAALVGQGMSLFDAAQCGVFIHGCAGDYAAEAYGEASLIASDCIDFLPTVFLSLGE